MSFLGTNPSTSSVYIFLPSSVCSVRLEDGLRGPSCHHRHLSGGRVRLLPPLPLLLRLLGAPLALVGVVLAAPRLAPAAAGLQSLLVPAAVDGGLAPVADPAHQTQEGPPHLPAGQRVNDRVHGRVEHGHGDEPVGLVEDGAATLARHVQQQQDEDGRPAGDEDPDDDDDGAQQRHGVLGVPVLAHLPAAGLHQDVDAGVEDRHGQEQDHEHYNAEGDIFLGVEREDGGAVGEVVQAVPAENGQSSERDGDQPAGSYEQEDSVVLVGIIRPHLDHSQVSLYCDSQETEDGGTERNEHAPLSDEPEGGRELQGLLSGQEQVHQVGDAGQHVAQCQVADEVVHAVVEPVVSPYGHQHGEVLQDDEAAHDEERDGLGVHGAGAGADAGPVVQLPRIVVVEVYLRVDHLRRAGRQESAGSPGSADPPRSTAERGGRCEDDEGHCRKTLPTRNTRNHGVFFFFSDGLNNRIVHLSIETIRLNTNKQHYK